MSAVPPDPYSARFLKFMKEVFELDQKSVRKDQEQDMEQLRKEIEGFIKKQIAEKIKEIFTKNGNHNKFIQTFRKNQEEQKMREVEEAKLA